MEGEIWDIEYLGEMKVFKVSIENGRNVKEERINEVRKNEKKIKYEERVWV